MNNFFWAVWCVAVGVLCIAFRHNGDVLFTETGLFALGVFNLFGGVAFAVLALVEWQARR